MRLASARQGQASRLGLVHDDRFIGLDQLDEGLPDSMRALIDEGPAGLDRIRRRWSAADQRGLTETAPPIETVALTAPLPRPNKVIAVGLNYQLHAQEGGRSAPQAPMLFAKFSTCIVGPEAEIEWDPELTGAVDYEAELAVVIGRTARRIAASEALDHVFGYTCINDVSARDLQFADKQWVRSKSLDTFGPMGPVIVTPDELGDPQALMVRAILNGEVVQEETTASMVFGVAQLIAFCSQAFTLEPGDVIATGTPSGVGYYREPQRLLRDGDEIVIEIDRIGRLVNRCRERRA